MDILRIPRTDPVYNAHGYLTKVPIGAICPLIERFTRPGDLVLDPFAGSGMTGVAAYICSRRAVLNDVSQLGRHIAENFLNLVDSNHFVEAANKILASIRKRIDKLYGLTCHKCRGPAIIAKVVWSFVYQCPKCFGNFAYYDCVTKPHNGDGQVCPLCNHQVERRTALRMGEQPVVVYLDCDKCGSNVERRATTQDVEASKQAEIFEIGTTWPDVPIPSTSEMYRRSALAKNGLESTAKFFSPRNLRALAILRQEIDTVRNEDLRAKLLFAFTAILPRASKRYQWGPKRPLNAQNQTYYIAPVFYEWNVLDLFMRKVRAVLRSDEYIRSSAGGALFAVSAAPMQYRIGSASDLSWLEDNSVDYVFTDPPFGSNIFYSDMSLFHEAWLGRFTDPTLEAVIHTDSKRKEDSAKRYEQVITKAISEMYRVLKPGKWATVVFSNSRGGVWAMLQRGIKKAGFCLKPEEVLVLDKGQRSVKGLNSGREDVVTVDLILNLWKSDQRNSLQAVAPRAYQSAIEMVREILATSPQATYRTPSHIYLASIRWYLTHGRDLEQFHFSDVLDALRQLGYRVHSEKGVLVKP